MEDIIKFIEGLPYVYILPALILLLKFILKLFVYSKPNGVTITVAIFEIPVNALFLSLSFVAAFIIGYKVNVPGFFILFISLLIVILFSIICWRGAENLLLKKKYGWSIFFGILNFIVAIPILVYSVLILISKIN